MVKPSQQERIMQYIKQEGGTISSNLLRDFAHRHFIANPGGRIRELVKAQVLDRRWMTNEEMNRWGYKKRVMMYYVKGNGLDKAVQNFLKDERGEEWRKRPTKNS